jgi:hypothetical protein
VALERLSDMDARGSVPEPHGIVVVALSDDLSIRDDGDGAHKVVVALERLSDIGDRGSVLDPHGVVVAA